MPREGVLIRVSCSVVGLAWGAGDTCDGGEHNEESQVVGELDMQIVGAVDFGGDGGVPFWVSHVFKNGILLREQRSAGRHQRKMTDKDLPGGPWCIAGSP